MPPRLNLIGATRSLAVRSRPSVIPRQQLSRRVASQRAFADEKGPKATPESDPNVIGHVSEEAVDMGNVTGETKPDLNQGTPVQEILKRDEEGKKYAPQVIKDESNISKKDAAGSVTFENLLALGKMEAIASGGHADDVSLEGLKFGEVQLPLAPRNNLKFRYDPVVTQVTNLLMKHGKLSVAQRNMGIILNHLRTAPPPTINPSKPLLPGAPPPHHLPLNPILYLTLAIDSVAPLLRIRSQKGAAGGGTALQIPVPLGLRQRRRQAVKWILDVVNKKKSRSSGKGQFAQRVAEEIVSVAEGKSAAWDRRMLVHKSGTSARINIMYSKAGRR